MASYQAPGASLVALLRTQLEGMDDSMLSADARRCLVTYARHLERKGLARDGDHLAAGLLLNAVEIALYLPTGKAGKGSVELTRLQERIERTQTAAKRAERRLRRAAEQKESGRTALWDPPLWLGKQGKQEQDAGKGGTDGEGEGSEAGDVGGPGESSAPPAA